jgi:hypothetical protein
VLPCGTAALHHFFPVPLILVSELQGFRGTRLPGSREAARAIRACRAMQFCIPAPLLADKEFPSKQKLRSLELPTSLLHFSFDPCDPAPRLHENWDRVRAVQSSCSTRWIEPSSLDVERWLRKRPRRSTRSAVSKDSSTFSRTSRGSFRRRTLRKRGTDAGYMASVLRFLIFP